MSPWIPDLDSLIQRDFKIWLYPPDTENFNQKRLLCRLIHWIRGVQIGLALGGGAARGMAHLGVFQALEYAGIVVDRIAGTSAGALSGIPYAAGLTPQYCTDSFTRDLKPEWYFDKMPGGDSLYMLAKYRKKAWDGMLRKYLHDWRLEQSVVPACSVAADLIESRQYICDRGDMVQGILESINLPVLSPPICRDGMALVDGGILNVLPANVLVDQGCNFVIGVNVSSNISHSFAGNTPETPTDKMNTPGVMATLLRVLTVLDRNMSAIGASAADFTINPDVADLDPAAFQETPQIAAKGRLAADQAMGQLREILQRLDAGLFGV